MTKTKIKCPFAGVVFASVADVPMEHWRWPNFSPDEIKCKGSGKVMVDPASMDKLQALRTALGLPVNLTSAFRSTEHNNTVGGATKSQHLKAKAYDVKMTNQNPAFFERVARAVGFTGFGFYPHLGFMHIDTAKAREWGQRWSR